MFFFKKWYENDDKLYNVVQALQHSGVKAQKVIAREILQKSEYYKKLYSFERRGCALKEKLSLNHKEYIKQAYEELKKCPFDIQTKIAGEILRSEIWAE